MSGLHCHKPSLQIQGLPSKAYLSELGRAAASCVRELTTNFTYSCSMRNGASQPSYSKLARSQHGCLLDQPVNRLLYLYMIFHARQQSSRSREHYRFRNKPEWSVTDLSTYISPYTTTDRIYPSPYKWSRHGRRQSSHSPHDELHQDCASTSSDSPDLLLRTLLSRASCSSACRKRCGRHRHTKRCSTCLSIRASQPGSALRWHEQRHSGTAVGYSLDQPAA